MPDPMPPQTAAAHGAPAPPPPKLTVDPSRLAAAAAPLLAAGRTLRATVPALRSAWDAAAHALFAQRTGAALEACQPSAVAAVVACAESVEMFGDDLQRAATLYRFAESGAVPARRRLPVAR